MIELEATHKDDETGSKKPILKMSIRKTSDTSYLADVMVDIGDGSIGKQTVIIDEWDRNKRNGADLIAEVLVGLSPLLMATGEGLKRETRLARMFRALKSN